MALQIESLELENGQKLLVEVIDVQLPDDFNKQSSISDLPEGADAIGVIDDMRISLELLKDDLKNISNSVKDAFKENQPDEFSVEVNFGFAGKSAIPFIVSAKANGAIKVKATWKKGS